MRTSRGGAVDIISSGSPSTESGSSGGREGGGGGSGIVVGMTFPESEAGSDRNKGDEISEEESDGDGSSSSADMNGGDGGRHVSDGSGSDDDACSESEGDELGAGDRAWVPEMATPARPSAPARRATRRGR